MSLRGNFNIIYIKEFENDVGHESEFWVKFLRRIHNGHIKWELNTRNLIEFTCESNIRYRNKIMIHSKIIEDHMCMEATRNQRTFIRSWVTYYKNINASRWSGFSRFPVRMFYRFDTHMVVCVCSSVRMCKLNKDNTEHTHTTDILLVVVAETMRAICMHITQE